MWRSKRTVGFGAERADLKGTDAKKAAHPFGWSRVFLKAQILEIIKFLNFP